MALNFYSKLPALLASLCLLSPSALAEFLPEDILRNALPSEGPANIAEPEFNAIISNLQNRYAESVKNKGGNLSIRGEWKGEKLNAGAAQMGNSWQVVITGALARLPELSPDGFTLILCHELGHHLGGFAFGAAGNPFQKAWAANEGQADYFSTHACAKKIWAADKEKNAGFRGQVGDFVRARCETAWASEDEQNLCYRISAAVNSMTNTMAALMKKPAPIFDTPDMNQVSKTLDAHPAVQCRMDTAFQGAICSAIFGDDLIPGKTAPGGIGSIEAEKESAQRTCTNFSGHVYGLRPACWFKARL